MNLISFSFQPDALGRFFALIFSIAGVLGLLFSFHKKNWGELACASILAVSAIGAALAGDWFTLFIFWEAMTVASLFLIWLGGGRGAAGAGMRYLLVHAFGGALFLAGILLFLSLTGNFSLQTLSLDNAASWMILIAVCLNAAVPPLHAWLTDAYPRCSPAGSVFQSVFTTKAAVCILIRLFPGAEILTVLGVFMALYGVVFAVLENDIRRLLSYHIISQVGYMVAGVGMGTALSLDGASAHAFSHILYKSLLFMGAGAVIEATGRNKLSEMGGLGPRMPAVFFLYMVGAFAISGAPLLNGFISKSMIVSAAGDGGRVWIETLLTLASVGTFLSIGLKLPYFAFFGPSRTLEARPLPPNMILAMGLGASLCLITGIYPSLLYSLLPYNSVYHPYTAAHILGALEILAGTALGFWLLRHMFKGKSGLSLDLDWFYRKPFAVGMMSLSAAAKTFGASVERRGSKAAVALIKMAEGPVLLEHASPIGLILIAAVFFYAVLALFSASLF